MKYEPKVVSYRDIKDVKENIVIVPEHTTYFLSYYRNVQKAIWWLSYLGYDGLIPRRKRFKTAVSNFVKVFLNLVKKNKYEYRNIKKAAKLTDGITHLCGSRFAYDMIRERHNVKNPIMFVEPISMEFLEAGAAENLTSATRSDLIAYNPAKPSEIMNKLLLHDELHFVPLKGMKPQELINLYRSIKLYVDFGAFPGPERIPKETVYNGTCILVGKRNAAANDFDVAIPDRYKIEDMVNEELIVGQILYLLSHYDDCIEDFSGFRKKIGGLEESFLTAIRNTFQRI